MIKNRVRQEIFQICPRRVFIGRFVLYAEQYWLKATFTKISFNVYNVEFN